jgi:hypothetical protein
MSCGINCPRHGFRVCAKSIVHPTKSKEHFLNHSSLTSRFVTFIWFTGIEPSLEFEWSEFSLTPIRGCGSTLKVDSSSLTPIH